MSRFLGACVVTGLGRQIDPLGAQREEGEKVPPDTDYRVGVAYCGSCGHRQDAHYANRCSGRTDSSIPCQCARDFTGHRDTQDPFAGASLDDVKAGLRVAADSSEPYQTTSLTGHGARLILDELDRLEHAAGEAKAALEWYERIAGTVGTRNSTHRDVMDSLWQLIGDAGQRAQRALEELR